jgi:hypothetical protein
MQANLGRRGEARRSGRLRAMRSPGPLARYAMLWIAGAVAAALAALWALGGLSSGAGRPPPQHHRPVDGVLASARAAGCSFQHVDGAAARDWRPPAGGRAHAGPAPDGAYAEAPARTTLVAALAAGTVVIQFRPGLPRRERAILERLYGRDRRALILTPDGSGMRAPVAATAWQRVLTCPRVEQKTIDAVAEFRDRFRGRGRPDG